jgi:hypothetical protein
VTSRLARKGRPAPLLSSPFSLFLQLLFGTKRMDRERSEQSAILETEAVRERVPLLSILSSALS